MSPVAARPLVGTEHLAEIGGEHRHDLLKPIARGLHRARNQRLGQLVEEYAFGQVILNLCPEV